MKTADPIRTLELEADVGIIAPVRVRALHCAVCRRNRRYVVEAQVLVFDGRDRRSWWKRRKGPCRCETQTRDLMIDAALPYGPPTP